MVAKVKGKGSPPINTITASLQDPFLSWRPLALASPWEHPTTQESCHHVIYSRPHEEKPVGKLVQAESTPSTTMLFSISNSRHEFRGHHQLVSSHQLLGITSFSPSSRVGSFVGPLHVLNSHLMVFGGSSMVKSDLKLCIPVIGLALWSETNCLISCRLPRLMS